MERIIVQVPMTKKLRQDALNVALDLGFSSLQEAIRVLLNKLSKREFTIAMQEEVEEITHLSKAAQKRYKMAIEDIKAGRNLTKTKNVDELLSLLRS